MQEKEYRAEGGHTQKKPWEPHLENNVQPGTRHRAHQEMGTDRTVQLTWKKEFISSVWVV